MQLDRRIFRQQPIGPSIIEREQRSERCTAKSRDKNTIIDYLPKMDEYLLSQAERYNKLLAAVKPTPKTTGKPNIDTDITINVRIRPILEDDEARHITPAVVQRARVDGLVDLHELRRPVRGLSTLNVRALPTP
jgi:hypothetical protein